MGRLYNAARNFVNDWIEPVCGDLNDPTISVIIPVYKPTHLDVVIQHLNKIAKSIEVVLDPTLLLTAEEYAPLISKFTPPKEPYLFMYTLSTAPFYIETAKRVAKMLGVKAIIVPMYQYSRLFAPKGLIYGISPDCMVGYIANAKYVLAGSFHGTAFATIFKKPFLSLREQPEDLSALSRPGTLLKLTGNLDRIVTPETSIDEMLALLQQPRVDNGALNVARADSKAWLEDALSSCVAVDC